MTDGKGKAWLERVKGDLFGGVTTAVVSLPLALAFGVSSGAGAMSGLYGAVLVGFWAALFGGTRTLISEPTGPMTLMLTAVLTRLVAADPEHGLAMGFTVVMMAGVFQIAFGMLRLGRYITLMPYSVISGFMSGIGVLLIALQVGPLLGHPTPPGGAVGVIKNLPDLIENLKPAEFFLGGIALVVMFAFPAQWRKRVPPALVMLLGGSLAAWLFFPDGALRTIGEIPKGLPNMHFPVFTWDLLGVLLVDAIVLGMLGCIDTTLTAMISDSLTRHQHRTNRELIGQGIGNLMSGLFGGLPGAGATMGTVVNIQCGATTRLSGMSRAMVLLAVVLVLAPLLSGVPLVVLAAITAKVGFDILDWSFLRRSHRVSRSAAVIMFGVLLLTVLVDIIVAVGIGVFIANLITIDRLSRVQEGNVRAFDVVSDDLPFSEEEKRLLEAGRERLVVFHLSGPMIFGVAKAISRMHEEILDAKALVVDLRDVPLLGTTAALALENLLREAHGNGTKIWVSGASKAIRELFENLKLTGERGLITYVDDRLAGMELAIRDLEKLEDRTKDPEPSEPHLT
ncbi:MAG TPA: SulP family inorganic anion transporter [Kiritimatiellia bacterium]|nr:SulP family inorganic anion transporter [Kiritimatiellia bacterium]